MTQTTKAYILDMDGTLYLDDELIEGAKDFVELLEAKNIPYVLLTNNSSKHAKAYVEKFHTLGLKIPVTKIITSGQATIHYLKTHHPTLKRLCLLGNRYLKEEFMDAGFTLVDEGLDLDAVVLGFDTELTYQKLWHASDALVAGKPYFATHPDSVCPLKDGAFMPDVGAFIELLKKATTREPIIIGKPYAPMMDVVEALLKTPKEQITVVGDRLYTDMQMASDYGMQSVLVLSGETTETMLEQSPLKPTRVITSVKTLYEELKAT